MIHMIDDMIPRHLPDQSTSDDVTLSTLDKEKQKSATKLLS